MGIEHEVAFRIIIIIIIMDNFSFFNCSSPFCFLLIEFHCTFSISY